MLKKLTCVLLCLFTAIQVYAQLQTDYVKYHKAIIDAEYRLFVKNDVAGLEVFKKTFDNYGFVFIDDCMEAFQVALVYHREDFAMQFLKKAMQNGLELEMLQYLNYSCPCTYFKNRDSSQVSIYKPFITKNEKQLKAYAKTTYPQCLARIDTALLNAIITRHVREQLFKGNVPAVIVDKKNPDKEFYRINNDNVRFIDSLAQAGIFMGEKNLGIYTRKMATALHLPIGSLEDYCATTLRKYNLPATTYVPVYFEGQYFDAGMLYIILFHKTGVYSQLNSSYAILSKYKDAAIRQGYLHPREYESLKHNNRSAIPADSQLHLIPGKTNITNRVIADALRKKAILPSLEIDSCKHAFAHRYQLQLFFGFNNNAR